MAIGSARGDATSLVGFVEVYEWNGAEWVPDAVLHVPYAGGMFDAPRRAAHEIDMHGDRLVFSVLDYGQDDWGAVCIYEKTGGQWVLAEFIENPSPTTNGYFGSAVAIEGDLVLVGAERFNGRTGRVYGFERNAAGSWVQTFTLDDSQGGFNEVFGRDLELEGDRLAVVGGGEVTIFERNQGVWVETSHLVDTAQALGLYEVEMEGDLIATGTWYGCPDGGICGEGWGYVFRYDGSTWTQGEQLVSPNPFFGDSFFGSEIALDGGRVLIGATGSNDIYDTYNQGAGYLYEDRGHGYELTQIFRPPLNGIQYASGAVLDLDGDRLAFGMPFDFTTAPPSGALAVFDVVSDIKLVCRGTVCPCGNDNAKGGCDNSATVYPEFRSGLMDACGSTSVASDDLTLSVWGLPQNTFGLMIMGTPGAAPAIVGDGLICLDPVQGIFRFPTRSIGSEGSINEGPGLAAYAAANLPAAAAIQAGSSFTFQFWYRDAGGPCQAGSNVSNGVEVLFRP